MSWVIALYLLALLDLRWSAPWLPVLPLVLLLPLAFRFSPPFALSLAFLAGVLRDGLFPEPPWFSPLLFLLVVWAGIKGREHLNLSLPIPRILTFFLLTFVASVLSLSLRGEAGVWSRALATGMVAALFGLSQKP